MTLRLSRRAVVHLGAAGAVAPFTGLAARALAAPTPMPPVEAYAVPFVDRIALSPDGGRVAVISQRGDEKVLTHLKIGEDKGAPMSLASPKIRDMFFGDNGHAIVVTSFTEDYFGKRELFLAYSVDLAAMKALKFFDQTDDTGKPLYGNLQRIKRDGVYCVTASTLRRDADYSLCLYSFDLNKHTSFLPGRLLDEGTSETEAWVVTPDGYPFARSEYSDKTKVWQVLINHARPGDAHDFRIVYQSRNTLPYPSLAGLGQDGDSVVIFVAEDGRSGHYYEISRDGVKGPALDPDGDGHDRSPVFHPLTRRLTGFVRHDDWFAYDFFDPLMKKLGDGLSSVMGDGVRCLISHQAEDPRKMIVYTEGDRDAGSFYFIDFGSGQTQSLASNFPDLPPEWIRHKTAIAYRASDGLDIHGYLTLPPFGPDKNLPLVVLPHASPEGRDFMTFDGEAQLLASRGYAVLQPNYRGSTGYGRDFIEKGYGEWGGRMRSDLADGVRWLAAQGIADPRRVAIMGRFYGGYAALAGATFDDDLYRCAISNAGPADLKAYLNDIALKAQDSKTDSVRHWKRFMGDPSGLDAISPARHAEKAACPVLLLHGQDDVVVPIDQSKRMEAALKSAGKPVEFKRYKGQDHWNTVGSMRVAMLKDALDFLNRYNPAG
jgi:dipeptidyl aminopeptidase/acylaminoacyl peptidase